MNPELPSREPSNTFSSDTFLSPIPMYSEYERRTGASGSSTANELTPLATFEIATPNKTGSLSPRGSATALLDLNRNIHRREVPGTDTNQSRSDRLKFTPSSRGSDTVQDEEEFHTKDPNIGAQGTGRPHRGSQTITIRADEAEHATVLSKFSDLQLQDDEKQAAGASEQVLLDIGRKETVACYLPRFEWICNPHQFL